MDRGIQNCRWFMFWIGKLPSGFALLSPDGLIKMCLRTFHNHTWDSFARSEVIEFQLITVRYLIRCCKHCIRKREYFSSFSKPADSREASSKYLMCNKVINCLYPPQVALLFFSKPVSLAWILMHFVCWFTQKRAIALWIFIFNLIILTLSLDWWPDNSKFPTDFGFTFF